MNKRPTNNGAVATRWLSHCLAAALVAALGYYVWKNWAKHSDSLDISLSAAILICLCILGAWLVNAAQSTLMLRVNLIRSGFFENLLVQTAAILGNYLPMRAGTALRFHYFKVVHKVDYSLFGGLSAVRMVLLILATSFASLLGLIATEHEFSRTLWLLYGGLAAIGISLLVGIRYVRFSPTSRLGAISIRFVEGFASIGRHPWEACATLGLIFVQFSLLGVRMAICFAIIGQSISPSSLLLIVPIATLLSFLTITPGNLGLREWTIGAVSLAAGLDLSTGVFAVTLDRAILVALTFAIGGPSLWWTLIKIRHARKSAN